MKRLKKCVLIFSILTSPMVVACGDYLVVAQVIMKDGVSSLVINPGTKSEINLKVEFAQSAKLSPYIDRTIEVLIRINEPMDATRGYAAKLGSIKELAPDPLSTSKGTSIKLINKINCKKN